MMKKILTTISLLLFGITIYAQQENQSCGTSVPSEMWENEFQKLILEYKTNPKSQKPKAIFNSLYYSNYISCNT